MAALPTYEEATSQPDPWTYIASSIDLSDLPSCCRVCQRFFGIFAPLLWAEPLKLLGRRSNLAREYQKLHATIQTLRPRIRELTVTLDLTNAPVYFHSRPSYAVEEASGGNWLSIAFSQLPRLQFVILDGHLNLTDSAIERASEWQSSPSPVLFSVADCRNLSAPSLKKIPAYLNKLLYLDISGTKRTSSLRSMFQIGEMENLRILKLHDLFLTDDDLADILARLRTRLWSLDVRNNRLSDGAINIISRNCFLPRLPDTIPLGADTGYTAEAPLYTQHPTTQDVELTHGAGVPITLRPDSAEAILSYINAYTHPFPPSYFGRDRHDVPLLNKVTGLTHLRISGNKLTSGGVRALLRATNRLQLLDVGSVMHNGTHPPQLLQYPTLRPLFQQDTSGLLRPVVSQQLQHLRIHHSIVTQAASILSAPHVSKPKLLNLTQVTYPQFELDYGRHPFLPDTNPRISSLTLTDLPRQSPPNGSVIPALTAFLRACAAQERAIAAARAVNSQTRRAPRMLSGLRVLRLEFERSERSGGGSNLEHQGVRGTVPGGLEGFEETSPMSATTNATSKRAYNPFYANETSISEDADADAFTAASMGDFSFFEDDSSRRRTSTVREADRLAGSWDPRGVVEELKAFRLKSKIAWERGEPNEYWTGSIELVM